MLSVQSTTGNADTSASLMGGGRGLKDRTVRARMEERRFHAKAHKWCAP
jgi:hypothetical protein